MTRIVAGTVGGRRLKVPPGGTRPTSDRVREAVFSRLDHLGIIEGAVVIDLYAGSGAFGLESASRGAETVHLVEADRAAAATCRANVSALGLSGVQVHRTTVEQFCATTPLAADVIFADPPYDIDDGALHVVLSAAAAHLAEDGVLVLETTRRRGEPNWPELLELDAARTYGETSVWYLGRGDSR